MLARLRIVDLAIIEEVELALGRGLNVLTGETGAGKSIIVGAAGLLRGGRASPELVRSGSEEAVVEALFDLSDCSAARERLEQAGLPTPGNELLVRRVIARGGRSRAYLNGSLSTNAVLAETVARLLDISGQHEHQLLSNRATHRQLLDELGTPAELLEEMAAAHASLRSTAEALSRSQMDDRQRASRIDFLRFQLGELSAAALRPGEDLELESERQRLRRASELEAIAQAGEQELYSGESSVGDRMARLGRQLQGLSAVDRRLEPMARQLEEARVLVEDVALSLGRYASGVEMDPARLAHVEERLDLIYHLKRKHGASVDAVLQQQQTMEAELAELTGLEQRLAALEQDLANAQGRAAHAAESLSAARQRAARRLSTEVAEQLRALRMAGARLNVELSARLPRENDEAALIFHGRRLGVEGWDRVELFIATNPGEALRPLALIASGGELSRVMLALRRVLGEHDPVSTSIYDEVDAGIGGAVADAVGRVLAQSARHRQVLCVTHLPQVAAHADLHFFVGKSSSRRRTRTAVQRLSDKERVEELARMLGGEAVTAEARANARRLLETAQESAGGRVV